MSTVIAATSGSPSSRRAIGRVAELFDDSDIVVAMVVPGRGAHRRSGDEGRSDVRIAIEEIAIDAAHEVVNAACERIGTMARPVVLLGEPAMALCDLARSEGAEAIVVGSLGSDSIRSLLGPSVGDDLRIHAPCTVIELGGT